MHRVEGRYTHSQHRASLKRIPTTSITPLQGGKRTAELVHRVEEKLGRYANELEELKGRLALAAALLQPDPAPTEVQLTLVTDASSCEILFGKGEANNP